MLTVGSRSGKTAGQQHPTTGAAESGTSRIWESPAAKGTNMKASTQTFYPGSGRNSESWKVKLSAVCVDNMHALLSQCNLNSLKYDC